MYRINSFNVQYGRVNAPDVDVVNAAKSADIHEKILTFPESYNTQVKQNKKMIQINDLFSKIEKILIAILLSLGWRTRFKIKWWRKAKSGNS